MATEDIERLHYYQRQYLGAQDFEDQQAYHRDMRRRHNLAHHIWGIVAGLELFKQDKEGSTDAKDVYILPGIAIDGYGREIVLLLPAQLDPGAFAAFRDAPAQYRSIWLEYSEEFTQRPQAGYEQCDTTNQFGRVRETYRIVVEPDEPFHDTIIVAGSAMNPVPRGQAYSLGLDTQIIPGDESIPYQEFPDEATAPRWLIQVGSVYWDGKQFVDSKKVPVVLNEGRKYAGSITSELLIPARELLVRDRNTAVPLPPFDPNNPPDPPDGVAMTIEGTLQVDRLLTAKGDLQIHGGVLDFRDRGGDGGGSQVDDKKLFTISRNDPNPVRGKDLRLQIGKESSGKNRFAVASGPNDLFTVTDNGNTAVIGNMSITGGKPPAGNLSIEGELDFGSQPRQMIDLWTSSDGLKQYGIGMQANTTYFRSHSDFCWFKDGVHSDAQSDPGAKGTLQMKLDQSANLSLTGDLYFSQRFSQMLNLGGSYGIGVQSDTLYQRSAADFCWYLNGLPSANQDDPGTGGHLQMKLDQGGGLYVAGSTSLQSGLTVEGAVDLKNNLTVEGTLDLKGGLTIEGPLDLKNNLNVEGSASLQSGLTVGGAADLKSNLTVDGTMNLGSSMTVAGPIDARSNLSIEGSASLQSDLTIAGALDFGSQTRQMLNLWGTTNYGIGVQNSTLYYRSDSDFCWFRGGSHSNTQSDPGGGTLQMKLNADGGLDVHGSHIAFVSTVNPGFSVTLGDVRGLHATDSIYGVPNLWLDAAGTVYLKQGFQVFGGDGAEFFSPSEPVEGGDLVVLSAEGKRTVKPAESAYDPSVVGVVSTAPSFILRGPSSAEEVETVQQNNVAVALIGTVPCKVDADIAPIHIGDLLTTSPTKGHAQKMLDSSRAIGAVLGKAMGNLENGKGLVPILVMMC